VKKEFVFSAKFDTSEFDKSVEQMQQKMQSIYAGSDVMRRQRETAQRLQQGGFGSVMSDPGMEAYKRATQSSRREMDQMIAEQARGQEKLGKEIQKRSEFLKKLQEQQRDLVKGSKEELELKEKIARVEQNNQQMRETYRQRDQALNQAMDARESLKPQGLERLVNAYQGGGVGGVMRAGMRMAGPGTIGSIIGGIGAIAEQGAGIYRDIGRAPVRTEAATGSAVQGTLGRQVSDIYGRRSAFEQMFAPERARASQQAIDQMRSDRASDLVGTGGGFLKNIGAGIGAGAGVGALVGSFGGPIGTAGGALIGGGIGLGKGIWDIMSNERQRSMVLSPFSSTAKKRYESMLAEDMANAYETSYESQKKQNPFKTMAVSEYEQNWQRNLDAQRSMGLRNEGFYGPGGFMQNAISQGFTPDMAIGMSQGVLGAGGSTRMARDSAFGLQAQRGLDLTNASQVLGTLSGGLGSSESTRQATIKTLAEGMKLGLDDSKFAEENRRFTQITAEIIARSGARGETDQERIASKIGSFVTENTGGGLSAAKTAYEQYQQVSQETTGPRGVMRAAGFLSDPVLSKLSTITKSGIMQIREDELTEDHPVVMAAAQEAGTSPKELISRISGVTRNSMSRFKTVDEIRDKITNYAKGMGKEHLTEEDLRNAPEDIRSDFNKMTAFQASELGPLNRQGTYSRGLGTINSNLSGTGQLGRENIIADKLSGADRTGRMEDTTVKAMAADSKVVLDNFNEMAPAMKAAAESTAAWTREVREANAALQQALEAVRANKNASTLQSLQDLLQKQAGSGGTQPQAGKQSQ